LKERRESAGSIDEHTLAAKEVNGLSYYVSSPTDGYTGLDWLSIELGIFAGRLYINFPVCAPLTNYIQLADKNWYKLPAKSHQARWHLYQESCRPPTRVAYGLPQGADIMHTPIGYICQGRPLHKNHPFFAARSTDAREIKRPSAG